MKTFKASHISCRNEDGVVEVGFASDNLGTMQYLLLQRTLHPDQQDYELGLHTIYAELDSQNRSGYGGVRLIQLDGSTLHVEFSEQMERILNTCEVDIELTVSQQQMQDLKDHLSLLVANQPTILLVNP